MTDYLSLTNNPKNITVCDNDRYLDKGTARVVSRKVLKNVVEQKCEYFAKGCRECFTLEQEIDCGEAWGLTIGKGKKLY